MPQETLTLHWDNDKVCFKYASHLFFRESLMLCPVKISNKIRLAQLKCKGGFSNLINKIISLMDMDC